MICHVNYTTYDDVGHGQAGWGAPKADDPRSGGIEPNESRDPIEGALSRTSKGSYGSRPACTGTVLSLERSPGDWSLSTRCRRWIDVVSHFSFRVHFDLLAISVGIPFSDMTSSMERIYPSHTVA